MLGQIIQHLLDRKLTTVAELEDITGRSTSTVYRWINGESQPVYDDMNKILRGMSAPDARRTLVDLLTSDLPLIVNWVEDEEQRLVAEDEEGRRHDGQEVVTLSLLALDRLTDVLSAQHAAIQKQEITREAYARLISGIDETIRHLTTSRQLIQRYAAIAFGREGTSSQG